MNMSGFVILLIPLLGLFPICRDGQWNWQVVKGSATLSLICWIGWFGALIVGTIVLFT